jgi:hypothetical protein
MDRRNCLKSLITAGACCSMLPAALMANSTGDNKESMDDELQRLRMEKEFIMNWVSDLLDTMEKQLDREVMVRLMEGCGEGCYNRFSFKQDIAREGSGNLEKLIVAYNRNFEVWKDDTYVHIRFGEKSERCYCPAAQIREPRPDDLHCECTRATHQSIFSQALGYPVKVEIVQTLRRQGQTCQFRVKYA